MALLSDIAICNLALSQLGQSTGSIESFSERSVAARECSRWYDVARKQVLEAFNWSFARRRLALALHSDDPPDPWAYRYQVPADCIAPRLIWNPVGEDADAVPYDLILSEDGSDLTLVCDMQDAELIYTRDASSAAAFPALFVNALTRYLASRLARPLTGRADIVKEQEAAFATAMATAEASDANKRVSQAPRDTDWIRARA